MPVKLRLRRQGRKGSPYYHIVAADSRTTRDGKFLERLGSYNPTANPAEIEVNQDAAIKWLRNGAQPTKTVRAILRYTGTTMKYALMVQGKSEEEIERIYGKWWAERQAKVDAKKNRLSTDAKADAEKRMAAESKVREERAAAIIAKNTPAPMAEPVAENEEETPVVEAQVDETPSAEAQEEAPAAENNAEESTEA
jgi:small subunit ribosomal protein S16